MYQRESYASHTCAMCGAHELEELGDGNTECLACGFIFDPENPGMSIVDFGQESVWILDLIASAMREDEETREMALV